MGMIRFDEKNSTDFFVTVEKLPVSAHGGKRGDPYTIAGRNGTEYREDGTLSNYTQPYKVWLGGRRSHRNARQLSHDVASWLLGSREYCRLEDTYDPEYFRLARYAGPLNIEHELWTFGRATLEFDCKPEYYLKSGEQAVTLFENVDLSSTITKNKSIVNPYVVSARPLIRLTGRGQIRIMAEGSDPRTPMTDITIQLESSDTTFEIDCDSYAVQDPSKITYHTTYPVLPMLFPGTNLFVLTNVGVSSPGYVTKMEVIPRWWTA